MAHERLTRAELATETGISRPTISESVRRLDAADLVRDTGVRTTGRGRVGSYYALAPDLGGALVVGSDLFLLHLGELRLNIDNFYCCFPDSILPANFLDRLHKIQVLRNRIPDVNSNFPWCTLVFCVKGLGGHG